MTQQPSFEQLPPFLRKIAHWVYQRAFAFWQRWGEPTVKIEDEMKRSHVRFVSASMLSMAILMGVGLPLRYLVLPDNELIVRRVFLAIGASFVLLFFQRLVQRGYYQLGIIVSITLATVIITLTSLTFTIEADTFYYYLIVLVFASSILPMRYVFSIAVVHVILLLLIAQGSLPAKSAEITEWILPNYIIITTIVMIFIAHRNYLDRNIRQRIQISEDRYRKVSELVSDYAYSMRREPDGSTHIEWITDSFERLTGYSQTKSTNTQDVSGEVTFSEDVHILREALERAFEGETTVCQVRYYKANKELGWLEVTRKPEFDPETGKVLRVFGVGREVTSRKKSEEQSHLLEMQRDRMHLTQEFVHALSHDFRTSLSNIETNRYLIERKSEAVAQKTLQPHMDTIHQYVQRMSKQLDGLTAIADLADMHFAPASVAFQLDQIMLAYRSVAAAHHIALIVKNCDRNITMNMDAIKIQLALRSLMDNALMHTRPGGTITMEAVCKLDTISLIVSDDGEGIASVHLPYIFDLFYRADPARNVHKGGIGVGLSLVRFVAEAHFGTVSVTSEVDRGTTFTLKMPYTPETPQKRSAPFGDMYQPGEDEPETTLTR